MDFKRFWHYASIPLTLKLVVRRQYLTYGLCLISFTAKPTHSLQLDYCISGLLIRTLYHTSFPSILGLSDQRRRSEFHV